jgi:hypothetical protein
MAQTLLSDADIGLMDTGTTERRMPRYDIPPEGEPPQPKIAPRGPALAPPGTGVPRGLAADVSFGGRDVIGLPPKNPITLLSDDDLDFIHMKSDKPKDSALVKGGKNIAAFADMVLSIPGMFVGLGGDIGGRLTSLAAGESQREVSRSGAKYGAAVGEMFSYPIKKIMHAMGYKEDYSSSDVSAALETVNSWIGKGGDWIEKNTGGNLLKEDVQSIANTLMTVAPVPGVKALREGAARAGEMLPGKGKGKPTSTEVDAALVGFERKPGMTPEESAAAAREKVQEKQRADAEMNAEAKANDIVQGIRRDRNGQPIRDAEGDIIYREYPQAQIDAIRKRNPLVGEKLDAIMAERAAKREGFGETVQGEVIPAGQYVPDFVPGMAEPPGGFRDITPRLPAPEPQARLQDLSSRFREEALAREQAQAAAEAAGRQPTGGGQAFDLDPITGRLRPVDQGLKGATPDTLRNLGRDRESAVQKLSEGRAFALTVEEQIAWKKAQADLSVVEPSVAAMDPKVLAERMRDRQWVADTIQKLREKDAGFAEIEAAARTQAEVLQARKAREQLMDAMETLQETLMRPREGKLDMQGPKTREAQRMARMRGQTGSVDPKLLGYVALGGGGAMLAYTLAEENKILSAIYGGLAGTLGPGILVRGLPALDKVAGALSTRMAKLNRNVADHARDFERRVLTRSNEYLGKTDTFTKTFTRLDEGTQGKLAQTLFNGDRTGIANVLRGIGDPQLASSVVEIHKTLEGLGKELSERGRLSGLRQDYFPRIVKDYEGLLDHLGAARRTQLERVLHDARVKALEKGNNLTALEETKIINQFLAGRGEAPKPGFTKARVIENVTPDLLPFYANPVESLHTYLRAATAEVEKARFFGKHLKTENGRTNLNDSIGALVKEELESGRMTPEQGTQLRELLQSRFGPGERSMSPGLQAARDVINMGLLGNPVATLTQVGDLSMSMLMNGLRPTLETTVQQLRGNVPIRAKEMGLVHHVAEEFAGTSRTARALDKVFRGSLFSGVDRFMKENYINSAALRIQRQLGTPKGQEAFAARWGNFFTPEELARVMDDFKTRRPSEGVQSVLWSELSDVQPVSRMEMPQAYNAHPNGRILYMLKSYTIKQLDIQRRMAFDEIRAGNVGKGLGFLAKYVGVLTAAGVGISAVKDWILGRDTDWGPAVQENILKSMGWSKYTLDKAGQQGPLKATAEMVAPPYKMFDDIIMQKPQATRYIPIVGPIVEAHFFGGKERVEERRAREERKRERE